MKTYFEDPTLRFVLFDVRDVLTASSENPDEDIPEPTTPIIGNP